MQQEIEHYSGTSKSKPSMGRDSTFYLLVRFFEESGYKSLMIFENDIPTLFSPVVRYSSKLLMNSSCSLCVVLRFSSASTRVPWHWGGRLLWCRSRASLRAK